MTEEKKNPLSDEEITALLERSPQEGTAELFNLYAGLVWFVAEKYLDNPEDIKECVNDTFLEFYLHRERFQPQKGELKNWLAAIARNLAVSRFRKNAASDAEELKEDTLQDKDVFDLIEKKMDLEQAMKGLSREDASIIRMKYYDGMTVQEIAASLGLPFETVKKRHQRSLKKLKQMLTLGLIIALLAALLAACAYLALRYFGIVPGYGVVTDPEKAIYTLAEPVVTEDRYGTYTVKEATVIDKTVRIFVDIRISDEDTLLELEQDKSPLLEYVEIVSGGETYDSWAVQDYNEIPAREEGMAFEVDRMSWHVMYVANKVQPPEDGMLTLRLMEQEIKIPVKQAEAEEQNSYSNVFHELGGLLAIPRSDENGLLMEIYPLNEGEYEISPNLIRDAYMQGKLGDITLAGENGREYTGEQVYRGPVPFSSWNFGLVEPGAYTLKVPYVYLMSKVEYDEANTILLNLKAGTWEDKVCELPFGTVSVVSVESVIPEELPDYGAQFSEDTDFCYRLVLRWEPSSADMKTGSLPVSIHIEYLGGHLIFAPEPLPDNCFEVLYFVNNDYAGEYGKEDREDLTRARLAIEGTQSILWDCMFEIPVVVK